MCSFLTTEKFANDLRWWSDMHKCQGLFRPVTEFNISISEEKDSSDKYFDGHALCRNEPVDG